MRQVCKFSIAIKALAKERPRLGRGGRTYTPARTRKYEAKIASLASAMLVEDIHMGPVLLYIEVVHKVPVSWNKSKRTAALAGQIFPSKGDLDNKVKAVGDALNGVVYVDDKQVVGGGQSMRYGQRELLTVSVYAVEQLDDLDHTSSPRLG